MKARPSSIRWPGRAHPSTYLAIFAIGVACLLFETNPYAAVSGLEGQVLAPDGRPAAAAHVTLHTMTGWRDGDPPALDTADAEGRFAFRGLAAGSYVLRLGAHGSSSRRIRIALPPGLRMVLPPLRLSPATFVRIRPVTPGGELVAVSRVVGLSFDGRGTRLRDEPTSWNTETAADGSITFGPLPIGMSVLGVDQPPFAPARLPDVRIDGTRPIVDAGAVVMQPAVMLRVFVNDRRGAPVTGVQLTLEPSTIPSPFELPPARTDANGRALFGRVAPARYLVSISGARPCEGEPPSRQQWIEVPAVRAHTERLLQAGSTLTLRLSQQGMPLAGTTVSLAPAIERPTLPVWMQQVPRMRARDASAARGWTTACRAITDETGTVTLRHVPPGPTSVAATLAQGVWSTVVSVSAPERVANLTIDTGTARVRAVDASTGMPVYPADVTWASSRSTVSAATTPAGDVVLDGLSADPARLTVAASGYVPSTRAASLFRTDHLSDVRLTRSPDLRVRLRVVDAGGRPIERALVHLQHRDRVQDDLIAGSEPDGRVLLQAAAAGPATFVVRAAGSAELSRGVSVPLAAAGELTIVLGR